jgi:hypothetical protein
MGSDGLTSHVEGSSLGCREKLLPNGLAPDKKYFSGISRIPHHDSVTGFGDLDACTPFADATSTPHRFAI